MNVDVYWNLHKQCYSVRDRATGKVVQHKSTLVLADVQFVVQPAGRERVRREGKKNVHAFLRGRICDLFWDDLLWVDYRTQQEVTYNPYKDETFVLRPDPVLGREGRTPIEHADCVHALTINDRPSIVAYSRVLEEIEI